MCATIQVLDIYDSSLCMLRIGPFNYDPLRGVDLWLAQSDEFLLKHLSTSPEVEPPHFAHQVSGLWFTVGGRSAASEIEYMVGGSIERGSAEHHRNRHQFCLQRSFNSAILIIAFLSILFCLSSSHPPLFFLFANFISISFQFYQYLQQIRSTLKYIQDNQFPAITVFRDNRPHYYQRDESTGCWQLVRY